MLSVAMIVKDEAGEIEGTLASVKGVIDSWVVCDTGSTDGTPSIVERCLADIPGTLQHIPFEGFARARNRALDFVRDRFALVLDSGDELVGADTLRSELARCECEADIGGYYVPIQYGEQTFRRLAILRTAHRWRYVGATHEVVDPAGPAGTLSGVAIRHSGEPNRDRWAADLALLAETAPVSARDQFYLAQTLECLGRYGEALAAYRERCNRAGWREEVYESLFRIARCAALVGRPWPEIQQHYLDAYNFAPHRAEPLRAIARHYDESIDGLAAPLAKTFHGLADALPFPHGDILFVDRTAYARGPD